MKRSVFLFCMTLLFLQCKSTQPQSTSAQAKLAFQLCQWYGSDQGIRERAFNAVNREVLLKLDSIHFAKLVDFVKIHGMPNELLLGKAYYQEECVKLAAFSILLHNSEKLVEQESAYHLFLNEVQIGRMNPEVFALIIDKHYWVRGLPLPYGGQFGQPCLTDKEAVNTRRKALGLKELEASQFKTCDKVSYNL